MRGISDCASDSLPRDIDRWVDSKGSTVPSAVVGSILRKPAVLKDIRRMRSASIAAMEAVSDIIKRCSVPQAGHAIFRRRLAAA